MIVKTCPQCQTDVVPEIRYLRPTMLLRTPPSEAVCPRCGTVLYRNRGQFPLLVKTAGLLALIQLAATGLNALGLPIPKFNPKDWVFLVVTAGTALLIALATDRWAKNKAKRRDTKTQKNE